MDACEWLSTKYLNGNAWSTIPNTMQENIYSGHYNFLCVANNKKEGFSNIQIKSYLLFWKKTQPCSIKSWVQIQVIYNWFSRKGLKFAPTFEWDVILFFDFTHIFPVF